VFVSPMRAPNQLVDGVQHAADRRLVARIKLAVPERGSLSFIADDQQIEAEFPKAAALPALTPEPPVNSLLDVEAAFEIIERVDRDNHPGIDDSLNSAIESSALDESSPLPRDARVRHDDLVDA
jgi:hypothetical protein